jgi:excisionase family DNA binding protein
MPANRGIGESASAHKTQRNAAKPEKLAATFAATFSRRLLTVREVAAVLGVSAATVYELCSTGELAHARVGNNSLRISAGDLDAYLRDRRR